MAALRIELEGAVECTRREGEAIGLTLRGRSRIPGRDESPPVPTEIAFAIASAPALPSRLEGALVEELLPATPAPLARDAPRLRPRRFRIASGAGEWRLEARSVHVHRDLSGPFFAAVPPRRAPFVRRLLFDLLPMLAGNAAGRALLRRFRRS